MVEKVVAKTVALTILLALCACAKPDVDWSQFAMGKAEDFKLVGSPR